MRILITNDDGVGSASLAPLVRFARRFGEVTVVAPKYEQSGKSQAIEFFREIEIKKIMIASDVEVFSMDSTPADCVRYAVLGRGEHFDLVISGINRGLNLGRDLVYSGTAGAIFEAGRLGLRGVALSTPPTDFAPALEKLEAILYSFMRTYIYTIMVTFEIGFFKIIKNAAIFAVLGFGRNFMMFCCCVILVALTLWLGTLFVPLMVISIFMILFSNCTFFSMYAAYPKIKKYMIDPYYSKSEQEEDYE